MKSLKETRYRAAFVLAATTLLFGYALVSNVSAQEGESVAPEAASPLPDATRIPTPTPEPQDPVDYGRLLDQLVTERVPIPDTAQATDVRSGTAILRADPVIAEVLDAIEGANSTEILARMEPLEVICGGRSGPDCVARTGANADGVYVAYRFEDGGALAWAMPETILIELLDLALQASDPELALVVRDDQSWDGRTNYLLVFSTEAYKADGLHVGTDPKHGFQLRVDPGAEYPIQAVSVLNDSASPLGWVQTYNQANQSLILPESIDGMVRVDDGLFEDSRFK